MSTYAHDHSLPPLPLPALEQTCAAIPALVAPLVDADVLRQTVKAVEDFAAPGGPGRLLHAVLAERAALLPGNASWLRPFWDDMYLSWRESLPESMNYFFAFDTERWGKDAALPRLVRALCIVLERLEREQLEPEQTKTRPLSMDQARTCLYTRIPCREADRLLEAGSASAPDCAIAVARKGHWFLLPLRGSGGALLSVEALERAFAAIRAEADSLPPAAAAVSALTCAPREDAAFLRSLLQKHPQNRLSLAALERSLFAVCLDEAHASRDDLIQRLLGGDATNRWFDKSLQLIATENGGLGANFEHAGCDAAIWLYLLGRADALLTGREEGLSAGEGPDDHSSALRRLPAWDLEASLRARLELLRQEFAATLKRMALACPESPVFSRDRLKALGTSPDSFLQNVFQAAQFKVFGKLRSSYEAVAVRGFFQGRTECARGSSAQALDLARALLSGEPPQRLLDLYRRSEAEHLSRMRICQNGRGTERHIYGLQAMHALYGGLLGLDGLPALFTDPGWQILKHDALSTSGVSAPFVRFFGFPPVTRDGFGVGYAPRPQATGLVVTARADSGLDPGAFVVAATEAAEILADALRRE